MRTLESEPQVARALARVLLALLLPVFWSVYALKIPASAGTDALRAAFRKKIPAAPAGSSKTSVSWVNSGAPLTAAELAPAAVVPQAKRGKK